MPPHITTTLLLAALAAVMLTVNVASIVRDALGGDHRG